MDESIWVSIGRLPLAPYLKSKTPQNWARLIQKIYEVDPLICPKYQGAMRIISFIEELDMIEKILRHLGLWDIRTHDPPQPAISNFIPEFVYDFSDSQIPAAGWN